MPGTPDHHEDDADPQLAIRRHTDRCFHRVEEVAHHADGSVRGYIVEGILISADDVAETVTLDAQGIPLPACRKPPLK